MSNFGERQRKLPALDTHRLGLEQIYPVAQQAAELFDGSVFAIKNISTGQHVGFLVRDPSKDSEEESLICSVFPNALTHFDRRAGILSRFLVNDFIVFPGSKKEFGFNSQDTNGVTTTVKFGRAGISTISESHSTKRNEEIRLFSYDAKVAQATVMGKDGRFIIPRVTWVIRDKDQWVLRADAETTKTYAEIDRRGIIQLVTAQFDGDTLQSTFEYTRETQRAIYAEVQGGTFTIDNVVSLATGKNNEIKVIGKKDGRVTEMDLNEERITHIKGSHTQPGQPGYVFEYFADGLKGWYRVGEDAQIKMGKVIRVVRETDGWILLYKEGAFEHEAKLTASGLSAFSGQLYDSEADREFYSADEDLPSYSASPHIADIWQTGGSIDIFLSEFTKNMRARGIKIK